MLSVRYEWNIIESPLPSSLHHNGAFNKDLGGKGHSQSRSCKKSFQGPQQWQWKEPRESLVTKGANVFLIGQFSLSSRLYGSALWSEILCGFAREGRRKCGYLWEFSRLFSVETWLKEFSKLCCMCKTHMCKTDANPGLLVCEMHPGERWSVCRQAGWNLIDR